MQHLSGRHLVKHYLEQNNDFDAPLYFVALGKAASAMALGLLDVAATQVRAGLVITKDGHLDPALAPYPQLRCIESSHPYADERSLAAGQQLIDFLADIPDAGTLVFLVSGGSSALVEVIAAQASVEDFLKLNPWLVNQALSIDVINQIRSSVSKIKAGRLAAYLPACRVYNLLLSDVPDDDPAVIAAGLLYGVSTPPKPLNLQLPDWLQRLQQLVTSAPVHTDPILKDIQTVVLGSNDMLLDKVIELAGQQGLVVNGRAKLRGEVQTMALHIAERLIAGPAGLYCWGGETVINLPASPGRGGRNQALALSIALNIQGHDNILLLVAGTDGSDGPTEDAGAIVDGDTIRRGVLDGYNAVEAIKFADAGRFLEASGDLLNTGPTGSNVMDVVLALKY